MERLTIRGTGLALGLFFDVSFALCVAWGLVFPRFHARWGTVFLYGIYIAVVFVPLFNYFEARGGTRGS